MCLGTLEIASKTDESLIPLLINSATSLFLNPLCLNESITKNYLDLNLKHIGLKILNL